MRYYISSEHKKAFDSIYSLYSEGGALFGEDNDVRAVRERGKDVIITAAGNCFYYDDGAEGFSDSDARQSMNTDGASWFAALRSERTSENSSADWTGLIERVSKEYHKRYSLLEFKQSDVRSSSEEDEVKRKLENVAGVLFPGRDVRVVPMQENRAHDVYGVTFLAGLSAVGESVPVLCKMYFRGETVSGQTILHRIGGEEAAQIDKNIISNIGDDGGEVTDSGSIASEMIDKVLGELDIVLQGGEAADYIVPAGAPDEQVLKDMVKNGPHGIVIITCKSVKVLGISHVRWSDAMYDIKLDGKQALFATTGLSGAVNIICRNCNKTIVDANKIVLTEQGKERTVTIDPTVNGLRLSDADAEALASKVMREHLIEKECRIVARGDQKCSRIVCAGQLISLQDSTNRRLQLCKDCPHEECAFRTSSGGLAPTRDLAFVRDGMTLINKDDVKICRCCGRKFASLDDEGFCKFCSDASSAARQGIKAANEKVREAAKRAKRKYMKFSSVLPLKDRIAGIAKGKFCFEAEELLLFAVGKEWYVFDKSSAKEKGYIAQPERVSDRRSLTSGKSREESK